MGVGKTTIGKLVAEKLSRDFIDIDEEIEKEYGMPVSQIFKTIGEKAFREKEKRLITSFCERKRQVISVGGGAFLQQEIRKVCLCSCIVFLLDISWEEWKDRMSLIIDSRPFLQGKSVEEMQKLYDKRQEIYSTHHYKVKTDNRAIAEITSDIMASLKLTWESNNLKSS